MRVYLVEAGYSRDNYSVVGIFTNRKALNEAILRCKKSASINLDDFEECVDKVAKWETNVYSRKLIINPNFYEICVTEYEMNEIFIP